jgi:hypothetical protein
VGDAGRRRRGRRLAGRTQLDAPASRWWLSVRWRDRAGAGRRSARGPLHSVPPRTEAGRSRGWLSVWWRSVRPGPPCSLLTWGNALSCSVRALPTCPGAEGPIREVSGNLCERYAHDGARSSSATTRTPRVLRVPRRTRSSTGRSARTAGGSANGSRDRWSVRGMADGTGWSECRGAVDVTRVEERGDRSATSDPARRPLPSRSNRWCTPAATWTSDWVADRRVLPGRSPAPVAPWPLPRQIPPCGRPGACRGSYPSGLPRKPDWVARRPAPGSGGDTTVAALAGGGTVGRAQWLWELGYRWTSWGVGGARAGPSLL